MSFANYSQYLAANSCCKNASLLLGNAGPIGSSLTGPTGFTGVTGPNSFGPTGKPSRGPTGPTGPYGGYPGPTGPAASMGGFVFTPLTFNAITNSITIPAQIVPLAYYTLTMSNNQSLNSVQFTSTLPIGSQAIIIVYGPGGINTSYITSQINNSTFASNINSGLTNIFLTGNENTAILTIVYDGTKYNCTVIQYVYA